MSASASGRSASDEDDVPSSRRRLRVERELYASDDGCRVFQVSWDDASLDNLPSRSLALKQVAFTSPEGPEAVVHEAGIHSRLCHDDVLRYLSSWTGRDVQVEDEDEEDVQDEEKLSYSSVDVPPRSVVLPAAAGPVDATAMLAAAEREGHEFLYILMELARATLWEALGLEEQDGEEQEEEQQKQQEEEEDGEEKESVLVTTTTTRGGRLWRWTLQTARALAYVHSDQVAVVHRDVNPWNVFIIPRRHPRNRRRLEDVEEEEEEEGAGDEAENKASAAAAAEEEEEDEDDDDDDDEEEDAVLADFGMAARISPTTPLHGTHAPSGAAPVTSSARGSLYSAPELGAGGGYGASADVFSWGMTMVAAWATATSHVSDSTDDDTSTTVTEVVTALEAVRAAGDASPLPPAWGCCPGCHPGMCSRALLLRDLVGRSVRLEPTSRPTMCEVSRALERNISP
jgi:serine/threonine protein kinase